ncbi:hypothetical protein G9H71_11625 [Motilibacter sp. E257]|uniref:EboA domain-containing protein n=1 Tax=Motilibacter deserti TaxID=2714956 RepID=A0ABX0GU56_9ACTN|nr:hypothetical protein [Motilibacter deserti]
MAGALEAVLSDQQAGWLADARARVSAAPTQVGAVFPAVRRSCGAGLLPSPDATLSGWTVDDAARALLLVDVARAGLPPDDLAREVQDLYRYGDAAERRAVLRALPLLDAVLGDRALPVVTDALRTNDTRIVGAAVGPYAASHLDADAFRQAVLKCVFVGVPLASFSGLSERADAELARMLADFAHERIAAGREVPADIWLVLDRFPEAVETAGLREELSSPVPERRAAAQRALAGHDAAVAQEG